MAQRNMIRKCLPALALLAASLLPASAQEEAASHSAGTRHSSSIHSVDISWGLSAPLGNELLGGGIGAASFALSYEYRIAPAWGVGFSIGCDAQSRSGDKAFYLSDTGQTTGLNYTERSQTLVPFLLTARWYPVETAGRFSPYVGMGVGAAWMRTRLTGTWIDTRTHATLGAALRPEVGVRIRLTDSLHAGISCAYRYCSAGWDVVGLGSTHNLLPSVGMGIKF